MENKEINKVFKQVFKAFAKEVLKSSEDFIDEIEECDTYRDLKDVLEAWSNEFFKEIGGECSACQDKEIEIDRLEDEKTDLEGEVEELKEHVGELEEKEKISYFPETLIDSFKLEAFKRNMDRFSLSEIESLLD
jgi:peptidoglycan hydrolase CwlO-like protein